MIYDHIIINADIIAFFNFNFSNHCGLFSLNIDNLRLGDDVSYSNQLFSWTTHSNLFQQTAIYPTGKFYIIQEERTLCHTYIIISVFSTLMLNIFDCERRELPSQYGRPKKRNKIFNIGRRTILYKIFSYYFSILN